jgi:hypothetical protein
VITDCEVIGKKKSAMASPVARSKEPAVSLARRSLGEGGYSAEQKTSNAQPPNYKKAREARPSICMRALTEGNEENEVFPIPNYPIVVFFSALPAAASRSDAALPSVKNVFLLKTFPGTADWRRRSLPAPLFKTLDRIWPTIYKRIFFLHP